MRKGRERERCSQERVVAHESSEKASETGTEADAGVTYELMGDQAVLMGAECRWQRAVKWTQRTHPSSC